MTSKFRWVGAATLVLSLSAGVGGCKRDEKSPSRASREQGPVVAIVGDGRITQQELESRLAEQPAFIRSRYASQEKKKEFLDNLVRFELLAQEARRRGLEEDPEVREMLEKVLVQRLVKLETESATAEVSDAEARAFYDANLSEFVKPERVRISQLVLTAPRGGPERQKAVAQAAKLVAELQRSEDVPRAFDAAVRAHSQDTASQAQGGDLGFHTRDELVALGGTAFADAAWALKTVGQVSAPIDTDTGVRVLMLQARQVGHEQTFDQAKPRITQRVIMECRLSTT